MRRASPSTLRSLLLAPNNLSLKPTPYTTPYKYNHSSCVNSSSPFIPSSPLTQNPTITQINSLISPWLCAHPIYARFLSTSTEWSPQPGSRRDKKDDASDETEDEELEEWEEEEQTDPVIGDGGDGGGILLRDVSWGERALTIAREVLSEHFGEDIALYAFKVSKGLCLWAERLLKVPEDLNRFKEMAMWVQYLDVAEDGTIKNIYEKEKEGIFVLERIELETQHCIWKLADVKENRAQAGKGRPLSRKQKDWR